jgi:hypothetical protein
MRLPRLRRLGWPPVIIDTSNDVPPISPVTASVTPAASQTASAATTPAAGPDSARTAGTRRASPAEMDSPGVHEQRRMGQAEVEQGADEFVDAGQRARGVGVKQRELGALVLPDDR